MDSKECIKFLESKKRIVNESFSEDLDVIIELLQEGEKYKQKYLILRSDYNVRKIR